jgi:peptidoglycan/LPS O-acetylase OafA/YrhL
MAAFYARRFLRIFPLYYLFLLIGLVLGLPHVRESIHWHAPYLSNYYVVSQGDYAGQPVNHLWTLAVEEQFYLVWPAVVLLAPVRYLAAIFCGAILLGPACRLVTLLLTDNHTTAHMITLSCFDGFGIGALLALLQQRRSAGAEREPVLGVAVLWAGLVLFAFLLACRVMDQARDVRTVLEDTSYVVVSAWLIERASRRFAGIGKTVLEWTPLVYIGTISYGVYVFHDLVPPLIHWVERRLDIWLRLPEDGTVRLLYVGIPSVLLAALSWHYFEKPLNNLKRHFAYVGPKAAV